MTEIMLGSPFSLPLHVITWKRPAGNIEYRVTNPFNGPDFLNGGIHEATDCGNTRVNDPVRAMVTGRVEPLRHFDGALGVRHVLPNGVTLDCWHLNRVDVPAGGATVTKGTRIGLTGNSGAKLPDGSPMPAHTHIRAERNGVPFDVEPYLPMVERAAIPLPLQEDDVLGDKTTFLDESFHAKLADNVAIRSDTRISPDTELDRQSGFVATVIGVAEGDEFNGSTVWWVYGRHNRGLACFHSKAAAKLPDVTADCSAQEATIVQLKGKIARARTANDGAQQAQDAVEAALA